MSEQTPPSARRKIAHLEIARLNDRLRANLNNPGSDRVVMTSGIAALIGDVGLFRGFHRRAELLRTIRDFDAFDPGNDPHGHRDLGLFDFEGARCLWKIDYYDHDLAFGLDDPADPRKTVRVLTVLRVDEY